MARTVWKNKFIIEVYELAKSGMTESQIANTFGISLPTFRVWEKKKPIFKMALQQGRKQNKKPNNKTFNFSDYVYKRLSSDLKKIYDRINKFDKEKNGIEKIEALLAKRGKTVRQHLFVYAWTRSNFSLSNALRKVNISRSTFEHWKKTDPDFIKLVEEINWHKKNFFEDSLSNLVASGDTSATIFVNKTYNRDRGYHDKIDIGLNVDANVNVNMIDLNKLDLSLKTRKEILKCYRASLKGSKGNS